MADREEKGQKCVKILFFDMEFANGKVPGSIYSIGYMMTDENFEVLIPPTDLLIDPDCRWNEYVVENILAYPKEEVDAAEPFFMHYEKLCALFSQADVAVGFAVSNDTRALHSACKRYLLDPISFCVLDTEKLCKLDGAHPDAHGLAGCVRAWCGEEPANQHRSDGDAYATMLLFRALCRSNHATPKMMLLAYPECCSSSVASEKKGKRLPPKRRKPRTSRKKGRSEQPQKGVSPVTVEQD